LFINAFPEEGTNMARARFRILATTAALLVGGTIAIQAPAQAAAGLPVAPYVDMGAWPTPSLSAMSKASGVKSYTLGFVTGAGCKASWFNAYDPGANGSSAR